MKLSDAKCRNARPKERPYKLADGHGLYLLVGANGSRLWRLDYRFDGKRLTMAIGAYPDTTLADAREARDAARKHLRDGRDPMEERKVSRTVARVARATTFGLVADELLAKLTREGKAEVTIAKRALAVTRPWRSPVHTSSGGNHASGGSCTPARGGIERPFRDRPPAARRNRPSDAVSSGDQSRHNGSNVCPSRRHCITGRKASRRDHRSQGCWQIDACRPKL